MYNGIGLPTPRGSGTNGHVQRNWAFVRPGKKDSNYRTEEDIKRLDATLNRPPNREILDHDRKRKIEVKCLEFEEILEKQGCTPDEIRAKVDSYRQKLMGQGKVDVPRDEFGRVAIRETHQIAEAQQKKNAKLREAFNISEYFVEGSSFDTDRKAKEDLAKSLALQKELDTQREQTAATAAKASKDSTKRYGIVRTPSKERELSTGGGVSGAVGAGAGSSGDDHTIQKKKKKKRTRESSASPERKRDKKKKSKKHKKESKSKKKKSRKRKASVTDSEADSDKDSADEGDTSDTDCDVKKNRKKNKKDKKKRDKKRKRDRTPSTDKSPIKSPNRKSHETKRGTRRSEKAYGTPKKTADGNPFRSRSSERSQQTYRDRSGRRYDSSRESRRSRSNRNSRNDRQRDNFSRNRQRYQSPGRGSKDRSRDYDRENNRRSRSRQRSRRNESVDRFKERKRKYSDERSSVRVEKRQRYSRSRSRSYALKADDRVTRRQSRSISRNVRKRSRDHLQKRERPRSLTPENKQRVKSASLTPPPPLRTSAGGQVALGKTNENNSDGKGNAKASNNKVHVESPSKRCNSPNVSNTDKKSLSRDKSSSSSSSDTASDSESSQSRTPSPRKEPLEKATTSITTNKSKDTIKKTPERTRSLSNLRDKPSKIQKQREASSKSPSERQRLSPKQDKRDCAIRSGDRVNRNELITHRSRSKEFHENRSKTPLALPPIKTKEETKYRKISRSPSRDSSELSYSPARRNPERYRDILENSAQKQKSEKSKPEDTRRGQSHQQQQQKLSSKRSDDHDKERLTYRKDLDGKGRSNTTKLAPVVRLHSQSEDESDGGERNSDKVASALDEFQESRRERELKELKMLEQLKTGIAAKAKEKIKTIEKMAATSSSNIGEVSDISDYGKRGLRNSLSDFLVANNVMPSSSNNIGNNSSYRLNNTTPAAIYPQNRDEIKKENGSPSRTPNAKQNTASKDNETQADCKQSQSVAANGHACKSPTASPTRNSHLLHNKDKERKRERERERERESDRDRERQINYYRRGDRDNERYRRSPPIHSVGCGGVGGGGINRRINNLYYRPRMNGNANGGGAGHLLTHNTSIIHSNNCPNHGHHNLGPLTGPYSHSANASNNASTFNRPSRINNTPLITATQFNNQMLSKQSNSILVGRRNHRTALSLGLSGTPATNFSNSNLLLTKANALHLQNHHSHHHHHHQHHHHHHSNSNNTSTQITDRILMAASLAAVGHHHNVMAYGHNNPTTANSLSYLQQQQQQQQQQLQQKPKIVIKPFKINDSQPLVAALADSTLVDTIVSKVSTATVAAAESAARRSRSRSRRTRSRSRHHEGATNRRTKSRSRTRSSSSSSRSRSRSHSRRSSRSRSHSSQSSSSSRSSSHSSSSSSSASSRSGSRSPSIPRRRGSPSFLDRRRITRY
uniref:Cwf21 domain-containing protein n=1 Tax=Glossina brevipalpis TaxID=37001 RepID=A0A1A9X0I3_9MUSC